MLQLRSPSLLSAASHMLALFCSKMRMRTRTLSTAPMTSTMSACFAQITSAFPVSTSPNGETTSLTAILYPHRRIRLSTLIPPSEAKKDEVEPEIAPEPIPPKATDESSQKGDVVASFEESAIVPKPDPKQKPVDPTSFLKKYPVSLVNVENLTEEPYDPKSQLVRAVTNEIVNVFKEVASMNSLFRDQDLDLFHQPVQRQHDLRAWKACRLCCRGVCRRAR